VNLLLLIIYYIAHNPVVKKKMLGEIDSIFQGDKMRPITKSDYFSLCYCEAIMKEVARIFPVNYTFSRWIDKPEKIAGYQWPADTLFLININAVHKNEGPGSKLTMIELVCLMALLFRKYEIDLVDMNSPINTSCEGVTVACNKLLVEIKPRN
jgi:cytochrome P450